MDGNKLTVHQQNVLKLCARSPVDAQGFSKCAPLIYEQLVSRMPAGLIDHEMVDDEHRIRLTDEAKVILKYLL